MASRLPAVQCRSLTCIKRAGRPDRGQPDRGSFDGPGERTSSVVRPAVIRSDRMLVARRGADRARRPASSAAVCAAMSNRPRCCDCSTNVGPRSRRSQRGLDVFGLVAAGLAVRGGHLFGRRTRSRSPSAVVPRSRTGRSPAGRAGGPALSLSAKGDHRLRINRARQQEQRRQQCQRHQRQQHLQPSPQRGSAGRPASRATPTRRAGSRGYAADPRVISRRALRRVSHQQAGDLAHVHHAHRLSRPARRGSTVTGCRGHHLTARSWANSPIHSDAPRSPVVMMPTSLPLASVTTRYHAKTLAADLRS